MSEKFSPEFQGGIQLQSALMGLTLAFKKKYGDEALEVTQAFAEQMGTMIGAHASPFFLLLILVICLRFCICARPHPKAYYFS